ncbi:MAG: polyhydroxyalkanoate granule-associated phasin [Betaproteobacteria bacterium]
MSRRRTANPFMVWTELALKAGEMMAASAQVIGHRTQRLALASTPPSARDQREFALMGTEKIAAATESAQAMALRLMSMNPWLVPNALRHMSNAASAMVALSTSRSAGEFIAGQTRLTEALIRSASTASHLAASAGELASHGIKPIHSRATANARRLKKR